MIQDCQSEEKFCYLKDKLIYPNKSSKIIFVYFCFLKNEEISSALVQNVLCQKIYWITYSWELS